MKLLVIVLVIVIVALLFTVSCILCL